MLSPIEPIHNRLQETVNSLYDEEHDPFAIAGCMLAIAIQLYRTQEMQWDGIKVLLNEIHKTSIKSEEHIRRTMH
jgi:hypothetical protein